MELVWDLHLLQNDTAKAVAKENDGNVLARKSVTNEDRRKLAITFFVVRCSRSLSRSLVAMLCAVVMGASKSQLELCEKARILTFGKSFFRKSLSRWTRSLPVSPWSRAPLGL